MINNKFLICLIAIFCCTSLALAEHKQANAVRIDEPIKLDGKLLDDAWKFAPKADGFLTKDPIEGAGVSEPTELYFLYDDKHLYIGARMFRQNPEQIQSFVSRRDNMGNSERIILTFDTYNNQTTSFSFAITATGVRADYYHPNDNEGSRDYNYNPVWYGKSHIDSLGWSAEIAIPFNQLRFNDAEEIIFGFNSNQYTPTNHEDAYWVLIPKNVSGWSSRFGKLRGIKGIKQSSRLEIMPYISAGLDVHSQSHKENHFFEKNIKKANIGVDFKMGFGPDVTLDATINPDFGQIEADPAVVNLTEFETYFDEKRSFFIEGNNLFNNSGVDYYYSRRIGAPPSISSDDNNHEDFKGFTTILGAAKLTGRTEGGLAFGAMTCFVNKETAKVFNPSTIIEYNEEIHPYSLYSIGRLSQELDALGSNIGAVFTAVNRKPDELKTEKFYNNAAYSGGVDFELFFKDKMYSLNGNLGFSHIIGTKERMLILQKQTTQNYQRPDAKHLSIDSFATSLSGGIARLGINKNSGEHWLWQFEYYTETPGLNLNDLGRLMHSDEHKLWGLLKYRENTPNSLFQNYSFSIYNHYRVNYGGEFLDAPLELNAAFTFLNKHSIGFGTNQSFGSFSDTKTRGGMMTAIAPYGYYYLNFNSDWSKPIQYGFYINTEMNDYEKEGYGIGGSLEYNYTRWKFIFDVGYNYNIDPQQYVMTINRNSAETYGKRYIFGKLMQKTLSSGLRLNYSFTPDLTFELYAQPFISNGKYLGFSELLSKNDFKMKQYGKYPETSTRIDLYNETIVTDHGTRFSISNQDFLVKSFRASTVLRYEYKPGCIFFIVWQINNSAFLQYTERITGESYLDAIGSPGINSLMIKLSYWFSAD